jgi:Alpha-glucuronidase
MRCWQVLVAILALTMMAGGIAMAQVVLAENGKSLYRIVVPEKAIPSERYAAEELQRYLERISGVKLPIVTDSEPMGSHEILLGDNAHLRKLGIQVDFAKLGTDGFVLRTFRNHLIIAGGRPRGTLYGVYALLEEKLGVRWFTPEVEFVPKMERVELPPLNEKQVPALEYREVFWTEMMRDPDFAARHRLNGHHYRLTEKHGGRAVVFYPFVHSFDLLIPREICEQRPEFWPMIGGKRVSGYVQRCLSNPDLVKLAIERVKQWIKEHPEATIIDVSQNDTGNWCQCPDCKALDDAEGSPSASIIKFVNTIAEAIEREYPHIRIETLAYQYSRKPPKTLRPHKNVIIRLCSIECCFAHPLETCPSEENRRFREDIKAWQPVAPLLYVWDYTTNFANYIQPFPNFEVLQANVQFFVKHGVKGLFEQGNYSPGGNGEMAPLRAYVLAKLLWNPDTDVQRHINDFLHGYYGRAAGAIRAYMELLHRQVREKGYHAHIFEPPTVPHLNNDEFLDGAERLFDEAERLAESEEIRFRVQVARLPVWYVKLATNRVTGDERADLLRKFLSIARKAGITHIREWQTLDDWAKKVGAE